MPTRTTARPRGRVVMHELTSAALADNPLGDPALRTIPVYLPPGYDGGRARYPVIYLLSGFTGTGRSFLNFQAYGETLPEKLDRLIADKKIGEMIVVMPDCYTKLGGSQYIDSPAIGRYETHLTEELIPDVDRAYRTLAEASHRGVAGKSSGGYGAMVLGMRHPDLFGALATHSGDCAFELCYQPDFAKAVSAIGRSGGLAKWFSWFESAIDKGNMGVTVMNVLAMAAAYSPNPRRKPLRADLPFDIETAELIPEVWARWLKHDPARIAKHHVAALKKLRLFYVDAGTRDEFFLHLGARILVRELKALKIKHHHEEFDGGHFNISYRYDESFPRLWRALKP